VKELRNNLTVLLAHKARKERRRISLKRAADETGINPYTIYAIANDTIKEYSKEVVVKLCGYLDCDVGDLLTIEETSEPDTAS
jgi:DNA-binding Xre family transcriptional regulator